MPGCMPYMDSMNKDEYIDQLLKANLPENFSARLDSSGSGGNCSNLQTAVPEQEDAETDMPNTRKTPVLKALQNKIHDRRKLNGQPEIKPENTPPKDYELTPAEKEKKRRRKEQNRRAAQRCREKKKNAEGNIREKYDQSLKRNKELRSDVNTLSKFVQKVKAILHAHAAMCCIIPPSHQSSSLTPDSFSQRNEQFHQLGHSTLPTSRVATRQNDISNMTFKNIPPQSAVVNEFVKQEAQFSSTFPSDQDSGGVVLDLGDVIESLQSQSNTDAALNSLSAHFNLEAVLAPNSTTASAPIAVPDLQPMPTAFSDTVHRQDQWANAPNTTLTKPPGDQHDAFIPSEPTEPNTLSGCRPARPLPATSTLPESASFLRSSRSLPGASFYSRPHLVPQSTNPLPLPSSSFSDALPGVSSSRASLAPVSTALHDLPGYPFSQGKKKRKIPHISHEVPKKQRKTATSHFQSTSTSLPGSASSTSTISASDLRSVTVSSSTHPQNSNQNHPTNHPPLIPPASSLHGSYGHRPYGAEVGRLSPSVTPPPPKCTADRAALTPPPSNLRHYQPQPYFERFTPSAPPKALTPPPPAQSPCLPLPSPVMEERAPHDDESVMGTLGHQPIPILPLGGGECGDSECLLSNRSLLEFLHSLVQSSQED